MMLGHWKPRSPNRLTDHEWHATVLRVRGEFQEMPCLRVSAAQARALFGLADPLSAWVRSRLTGDGFLECRNGDYVRRNAQPCLPQKSNTLTLRRCDGCDVAPSHLD